MGRLLCSHVLLTLLCCTAGQRVLESYNVDLNGISTSGFSSGGSVAPQLHLAYSSIFMGMGCQGAVPYYCAEGNDNNKEDCTENIEIDPVYLAGEARRFESQGRIDSLDNVANSRVFILQGDLDQLVKPGCADSVEEFYRELMPASQIEHVRISNLLHGFPTETYGTPCDVINFDLYINRCQYHGAYEILQHIYQDLERPTSNTPIPGDLYEFDQTEFRPEQIGIATRGLIYVPTGCMSGDNVCRLHVAFHGCGLGIDFVEDGFAANTYYHQVAELNNIIVLWPQATGVLGNWNGCWDWWGLNDGFGQLGNYVTRNGDQIIAVMNMVNRVTGDALDL